MTYVPDYYKPWPESYSFDAREPDWYDDQKVKEFFEAQDDLPPLQPQDGM
jgi:hypothetical protein